MKMSNSPLSDFLEHKFGSISLAVLSRTEASRIITISDAKKQVLEYSIVEFLEPGAAAYPDIHTRIMDGALLGKSFVASGIPYYRHTNSRRTVALSPQLQEIFATQATHSTQIDVTVKVGPNQLPYAHIIETYSPIVHLP